jgi:medium-chain acyl-[acyl-carrier-protein] hydrolase
MLLPMSETPPVWVETFKVHSYEVDSTQRATLKTLCHFFQEAAWNHAELLGVGYSRLQTEQRLWVLSRLLVKVERYPRWGDAVTVRTWPRHARSVFAMRDFRILEASGHTLAAGTSAWLVLDAATRKPLRADKVLAHFTNLSDDRALERDPEKLPPGHPQDAAPDSSWLATYSDIDVNGHVNYAWYIGCALNSRPVQFHGDYEPCGLEVNYLGETAGDETIAVTTEAGPDHEFAHSILKTASREEVCRLRLRWRKRLA